MPLAITLRDVLRASEDLNVIHSVPFAWVYPVDVKIVSVPAAPIGVPGGRAELLELFVGETQVSPLPLALVAQLMPCRPHRVL